MTRQIFIANIANMTDSRAIASTLRAIRAKLDLTQEQLAERLGVSFATVNRWEGGSNVPQKAAREVIAALAEEAGVGTPESTTESPEPAAGVTRRRRGAAAAPSTKSMEQMLWDAACSIRGEKDAAKFKDYLLPLLFLKRLSDVFDDEITRLAEEYGDRETALEIAEGDHSLLRFYMPPEARWGIISGRESYEWPLDDEGESTKPKDIGEHLTKAVRAVVKQNPTLSGVIDVVDFAAERNGERDINPAKLRAVIETFSDKRYRLGLGDVQPDFLGRAYEYLLRKFAEGSGQSAGEFFTPTEVGFLMAHIMRPRPGEDCHDYACGSAGLLVKLQLVARELDPTSKVPLKLTAQELQAESYAVAQMNGIIHDMEIEIARGDTMINPKFRTADGKVKTHDIVVANPMWNQPFNPDIFKDDPFDRFRTAGGVSTGKGDWAWLQHTLACLNDNGRAAVVLDTGAVTRGSGSKNGDKERNIRKWFVDHDLIDGVILLPDNLFYNTSAAGVIVVLNKRKPAARKDKIVLLNGSRHVQKGRPKNFIPDDYIRPLAAAFLKGEPVENEVAAITRQQVEEADYSLSPSRWVGPAAADEQAGLADILDRFDAIVAAEATITQDLGAALAKLRELA
ncbi:N-6 DNA methylase [Bradyrhizobium liaoningense]|uniref:N-6 DNA methylase n=1 Tax=Bradyrhizobium liaoningense TaxID=43992 RepID=UPI0020118C75|nr:N-6 DNA methylase [Bradyrhizobium liaoningense]